MPTVSGGELGRRIALYEEHLLTVDHGDKRVFFDLLLDESSPDLSGLDVYHLPWHMWTEYVVGCGACGRKFR